MRKLVLALACAGCSFDHSGSPAAPMPTSDAPLVGIADAAPAPTADAPIAPDAPPAPQPGDGVVWMTWPSQQSLSDPTWGAALTDIANHLPASYGNQYWDSDPETAGHETTHGINAELRNNHNDTGGRANAFYVLHDKAALVIEPDIRKSDVAAYVPASLRGPRYATYVTGQTAWDDTPLYLWDEWDAYVNGAEVAIDQEQHGLWTQGWTDAVMGPLEFCAYALAEGMAVKAKDPTYFAQNTQFREVMAWQLRRAMDRFRTGRTMTDFTYDQQDAYWTAMKTSADAAALRQFARDTYGASWTMQVLGF
jgi:hypothetical protein